MARDDDLDPDDRINPTDDHPDGPDEADDLDEPDNDEDEDDDGLPPRPTSRWLTGVLAAVVAVALVLTGGALAVITGIGDSASSDSDTPGEKSVDVGFSRDMSRHHRQAVEMAGWVRDRTQDPAVRTLAYDIETTQFTQIGQMQGLLLSWGISENSSDPPMQWMSDTAGHEQHMTADGLMPGMATQAEIDQMKAMQGPELDLYFLQLMLRHHQGGLPMAQDASTRASTGAVRTLAKGMANAQQNEIVVMEQMIRERGGVPLPPP